jgi:hypothetical protein
VIEGVADRPSLRSLKGSKVPIDVAALRVVAGLVAEADRIGRCNEMNCAAFIVGGVAPSVFQDSRCCQ